MIKLLVTFIILNCCSLVFSQPIPFEPDTNTVGLWHFNEGSGDITYDTSGNNLNGTLENGVSWDPNGMFGNCLMFSANYHRVRADDTSILDISTDLSLEAWIKLDSTNNGGFIISKWYTNTHNPKGQYAIGVSSNNKFFAYLGDDTSQFSINSDSILIEFNEWTMVAAVYSNSQAGLYINGNQVAASDVPFDSLTILDYPHDDLFLGDLWTDANHPYSFDGKIDEVRISNIARYQIITTDIEDTKDIFPLTPLLEQNYPNPFNPTTIINYQISELSFVTLKVYDVLGNEIATLVNEEKPIGSYEVKFDASSLPSGVYFYRLQAGSFVETKKMVLLR
jgi:hypothetical protein